MRRVEALDQEEHQAQMRSMALQDQPGLPQHRTGQRDQSVKWDQLDRMDTLVRQVKMVELGLMV
jgi:hypothetical protein